VELERITKEAFAPFGTVLELERKPGSPNFQIQLREPDSPWRMALLRVPVHRIERIERHADSRESFEPVSGWCVLFVSVGGTPEDIRAFLLDRPVCLEKGIWHGILSLTEEAVCKITENLEVGLEYRQLGKPLGACAEFMP
jgi:ureidoglycolate hydrolase